MSAAFWSIQALERHQPSLEAVLPGNLCGLCNSPSQGEEHRQEHKTLRLNDRIRSQPRLITRSDTGLRS